MKKRRYAIVGTGARVVAFLDPLVSQYRDTATLVGLCDSSPTRMDFHIRRIAQDFGASTPPTYRAEDFDRMLHEQKPDCVIVCTPDARHHESIIRALNKGCDVISEKPMTTDAPKCEAIFEAVRRSGKTVQVTFNCRWIPGPSKVRETLASGVIGEVKQVNFEYFLNTSHGADYFRRWHSEKSQSGGLLVHKATHHFDLLNWWIDDIPDRVFAQGGLFFYGKENAVARGCESLTAYDRYTGVEAAATDPFRYDLSKDERLTGLYLNAEGETGYVRDRNVFRSGITIEDTMNVLITYRRGTLATYSLNAFSPIEGMNVSFCGDMGRVEYREQKSQQALDADGKLTTALSGGYPMHLRVMPFFSPAYDIPIPEASGSHGGGDALISQALFSPAPPEDPWGRSAGHEQGAASLLIGAAANQSLETGNQIAITDLCDLNPTATRFRDLI